MDLCIKCVSGLDRLYVVNEVGYEQTDDKNFELKMITGNKIPVFLSLKIVNADSAKELFYDINSMISLYDLSKRKPLGMKEVILLIKSIEQCRESISEYLLSANGLILDPKYIFFDVNEKKIRFCYYPWNDMDIFSSYTQITEYLLSSVDYSDELAVDTVYNLYAAVLNKDFNLTKYIREEEENTEEIVKPETVSSKNTEMDNVSVNKYYIKPFTVVCLTLLIVIIISVAGLFFYSRRLFMYIFMNTRFLSCLVLITSILCYFPIMNLYDYNRARRSHR